MRYIAKKAGQKFENMFKNASQQQQAKKQEEGSISIDKMPPSHQKANTKVGEYVDYEEID